MKAEDFELLTFYELRKNFLEGKYEDSYDQSFLAGNALHNKLPSMIELVPLLRSNNRLCQYKAAYISSEMGEDARPIFSYLFELLESSYREVRNEVCDCFFYCTKESKHYLALFKHLRDPESQIRLNVLGYLCFLDEQYFAQLYVFIKGLESVDQFLVDGISLLFNQSKNLLTETDIKNNILTGSKEIKMFAYAAAYKQFGNSNKLTELVKLSGEPDILKHWEIYLEPDSSNQE
ncbi:MAG: hypothetical protein V7784_12930 [Oceanospirillaceae bacterium]